MEKDEIAMSKAVRQSMLLGIDVTRRGLPCSEALAEQMALLPCSRVTSASIGGRYQCQDQRRVDQQTGRSRKKLRKTDSTEDADISRAMCQSIRVTSR